MALFGFLGKFKIIVGVALLMVLAAAPSVYFYRQYQQAQLKLTNPTEAAKQDAKETIVAVGKLLMLPPDEEPTVMQVTDVSKLKDQAFFANAQNGDKVLIYTTAKKAILYRPGTNKIIDVAPVNIGNTATPSAGSTSSPQATTNGEESPSPALSSTVSAKLATPSATPKIIIQ